LCGSASGEPFLEKFGGYYTSCSRCGFVYANPRDPSPADFNATHNEAKRSYYANKQYSRLHQRNYGGLLRRFSRFRRTKRLLEIGCSTGGFCFRAREMGWEPVGVEPVEAVASFGREVHGLDVRACTLEEAGFPDGHFDVVFSNAVLEHLPSPAGVLREAFRVLRPKGVLYADTVNIKSYTWRFIGAEWKLVDPRAHLSLFTPETLRRFCEAQGFRVLQIGTHGVRFRPNRSDKLAGLRRWCEELAKLPFSLAARFTLRGDSIDILAEKP
jgi:SAM-dependent methyltransferase